MSALNPSALLAIKALCDAIVQAVEAAGPLGAPGGVLYAALMSQGCTLQQFEGITGGMVGAGLLCKVGECYHLGSLGMMRVEALDRESCRKEEDSDKARAIENGGFGL